MLLWQILRKRNINHPPYIIIFSCMYIAVTTQLHCPTIQINSRVPMQNCKLKRTKHLLELEKVLFPDFSRFEAQIKLVSFGSLAWETLRDDKTRRKYDRDLQWGTKPGSAEFQRSRR